jgi:hypothetical protein
MIGRLVAVACVFLGASTLAQSRVPPSGAQVQSRVPPASSLSCQGGRYSENGRPMPSGDSNCQRQSGLTATAIAINVQPSSYAYIDNPPCPGGNTDATTLALAKTQLGAASGSSPADMLEQLRRRANLVGRDAAALAMGASQDKASRCQVFVVRTPVRAGAIRVVEFRAHQNQARDNPRCMQANVRPAGGSDFALTQSSGGCAIGVSAWQSALVLDDPQGGAVVAGVFKNWSHDRMRTGQLWVWYQPAAPSKRR